VFFPSSLRNSIDEGQHQAHNPNRLGALMSQVMGTEPESRAWISPVLQEARRFRCMNIQEHANLVQAIMLNFPEIYDDPKAFRAEASDDALRPAEQHPSAPELPAAEPA
jgi:hypothetical protein